MSAVLATALAAGLAAAATAVALPAPVRRRLGRASPGPSPGGPSSWRSLPVVASRVGPVLVVAVAVATLAARPAVLLLAVAGVVVAWVAVDLHRRGRRRREAEERRRAVAETCDALVAALDAGAPPVTALAEIAREQPRWSPVARTAALGGDVPTAWRACARSPGAHELTHVAAAWQVSDRTGAPLAATLARVAGSLRDGQEARVEVEASLGPPRATARLLAVLPVLGLGLGAGLGGDPVATVTSSAPVAACVLAGVVLAAVGVVWVERVADAAGRP